MGQILTSENTSTLISSLLCMFGLVDDQLDDLSHEFITAASCYFASSSFSSHLVDVADLMLSKPSDVKTLACPPKTTLS